MCHIGGGVGHSIINLTQGTGGEDSMNIDNGGDTAAEGDEDIDYKDGLDKDDLDEDDGEEDGSDLEDDEDGFGPEDGEDEDLDYGDDGFGDF